MRDEPDENGTNTRAWLHTRVCDADNDELLQHVRSGGRKSWGQRMPEARDAVCKCSQKGKKKNGGTCEPDAQRLLR